MQRKNNSKTTPRNKNEAGQELAEFFTREIAKTRKNLQGLTKSQRDVKIFS
mgnify:CR=1 FL=1